MKKSTAIWLIAASAIMIFGVLIFVLAMTLSSWDFELNKTKSVTYEIKGNFTDISITADIEDVFFAPSADGTSKVVCLEEKNLKHSVTNENGELKINTVDERKWYDHIMNFGNNTVTVYLAENEYASLFIESNTSSVEITSNFKFKNINITLSTGNVKSSATSSETTKIAATTGDISIFGASFGLLQLSTTTGDIYLGNINCGDMTISVSTGDVNMRDVSCKSLTTTGNTGELEMHRVIATGAFSIERSTGDVDFEACDAEKIYIETDTGDVEGSLLSEKIFILKTDTGDVDVPKTTSGGICEITTDTGDIEIYIKN